MTIVATGAVRVIDEGVNYAGEPWSELDLSDLSDLPAGSGVDTGLSAEVVQGAMALSRALLTAGALDRVVELSTQYANEREQFGRPIGKFQILQHYLAEMAGEACAAEAAVDTAVDVVAAGMPVSEQLLAIGAAKAYGGRAVTIINRLAHQLHGAIGFTDEHRLQLSTRRLWAWRDEFGTEHTWAASVGRAVAGNGGSALWPSLTRWPPAV